MTDKETSTLQSYVDSVSCQRDTSLRYSMNANSFHQATGAAQSALGSLTGSQADKVN
jgi:hypothetical protein